MKTRLWHNPMAQRCRLLVLLVPFLLGAACDPQGPGAMGRLTVSPEAGLDAGNTLEIRLLPDDGNAFDPGSTNLSDENRDRRVSWNLAEIEFPFSYHVGGGLGTTEHEHWRVIAWIAKSSNVDRPMPGEYYGTRDFDVEDCGIVFSKYCGVMSAIDLEIDISRSGVSSGREESEPRSGEYIEDTHGDYTMRCMQGDDSAASIGSYVVTISRNGRAITEVTGARDGMIQDCWMTNIDADESAEVLLFSRSAGSGGYAQLYAYKFAGDELHPLELPDPDADLMEGYQGRDVYELTDGKLSRKFPIYLEADSNCCPGGGERVIEFDSVNAVWQSAPHRLLPGKVLRDE